MTVAAIRARSVVGPLFVVQFLSWGAMFCLWVYALPVVTAILGAGHGGGERTALLVVSGCFAFYGVLATSLAFLLPRLIAQLGAGTVYGAGLLVGAAGMTGLGLTRSPALLVPAFAAIAVAWSAMANIPYAIAAATAPVGRGAHRLRLFGFSTVIPQIVVSLGLALGASYLFGDAIGDVMLVGGVMLAAGGILALALRNRFAVSSDDW